MKQRDPEYLRLIATRAWRTLRNNYLSRHPLCEECQRHRKTVAATEVHHIVPVEKGSTFAIKHRLAYDTLNLRALCHPCHVAIHRELRKGTKESRQERVKAEAEAFWGNVTKNKSPGG